MASEQARQYLDRLHENVFDAYSLTPRTPSKEDEEAYARHIEEVLRARTAGLPADKAEALRIGMSAYVADWKSETISRYESPWDIRGLSMAASELEEAARRRGADLPERPLLGTLPTGRINARTLLVDGTDEHLVLFESQFTTFAYMVAQAIADVLPYTEHEDGGVSFTIEVEEVAARIERRPATTRRFGEMILAYLKTGQPGLAPHRIQERIPNVYAGILSDSIVKFALGHEYGHILYGHVGPRRPVSQLGGTDSDDPEEIQYSQVQEVEADTAGTQYMLLAQRPLYGLPFSYCGADVYFTMMDVFDRAISLLRHGEEGRTLYTTHPAPGRRRATLRDVQKLLEPGDQGKLALDTAKGMQAIVEMLWNRLRGGLLDAHRAGVRPLDIWKD
ncbi:MAG: hypothetical protein ACRDTA_18035 [Pseudonocardiaceae bacterium]